MTLALQPTPAAGLDIHLEAVTRTFTAGGNVTAVDRLSLDISAGDFVAILGPSGCGKSTLLRLIAGLEKPDTGHVHLAPPKPGPASPRAGPGSPTPGSIGYVFQDAHLLPWRTVLANVMLPLELLKAPADPDRAMQELQRVGLADFRDRYPAQLSGGMRMRVSLARAMVTRPRLLLLDEPFAALDEITRHALDAQLRRLWQESGVTVVFVTHSIMEATYLARRAVVLTRRPARIALDHVIDLPADRPGDLRAQPRFAHQMGVLLQALEDGNQ